MREIKFRAFNKRTNQMVNLNEITPLALSISPELAGGGIGVYVPDHPDIIVMQYTGLKDRNGKEIYEGDILAHIVVDWNLVTDEMEPCQYPKKEVMRDVATMSRFPRYWLEKECFGYEGEELEEPDEWEVIGNIHENPDLLKCTTHS